MWWWFLAGIFIGIWIGVFIMAALYLTGKK